MTSSRQDKPPPAARDGDLWDALRRTEPEALGELFSRYADVVHAYAVRHTGSYAYADDAVQATFVTAWRQFRHSDPGPLHHDSARPWLLAIARNELRNTTRSRRRLTQFLLRQPAPLHHPDHAEAVAARIDSERHIQAVRAALSALPAHERATVELVYWADLSVAEAAAVLGVAEGTVKARISRTPRASRSTATSSTADRRRPAGPSGGPAGSTRPPVGLKPAGRPSSPAWRRRRLPCAAPA